LFNFGDNFAVFSGEYTDFTNAWYQNVGSVIASATFVAAVFPVIELAFMGITMVKRCLDRRCSTNPTKTKKVLQ
jgi:hypothetical protein